MLKAFGVLKSSKNDDSVKSLRIIWDLNCNNPITEIKTINNQYRIFMLGTLIQGEEKHINVFMVPVSPKKDFVYLLQFRGFSQEDVGQIITTMEKEEK